MIFLLLLLSSTAHATPAPINDELLKVRDPFKRIAIRKPEELPRSELEMFATEAFKMVGVVTGPDHMRAAIVAPNGKTFFVSEHQYIGMRKGIITKITTGGIKVREKIINVLGQEEEVDVEIPLPSEKSAQK